jgi:hypothetical protein
MNSPNTDKGDPIPEVFLKTGVFSRAVLPARATTAPN